MGSQDCAAAGTADSTDTKGHNRNPQWIEFMWWKEVWKMSVKQREQQRGEEEDGEQVEERQAKSRVAWTSHYSTRLYGYAS